MNLNNIRLLVWMLLFMMMWFSYRAWLADYPPTVVPAPTEQGAGTAPELPLELPQLESPADSLPALTESGTPVETPGTPRRPVGEVLVYEAG